MRSKKKADAINYQARAHEFHVGDIVRTFLDSADSEGRVIAVFPAIGMADIQWSSTSFRHPVEDLQIVNPGEARFVAPKHETLPGGTKKGPVSEGVGSPSTEIYTTPNVEPVVVVNKNIAGKVAKAYVIKSLYQNREACSGSVCPKCRKALRKGSFNHLGKTTRIAACADCLFFVRERDLNRG